MVEQRPFKALVLGSSPSQPTRGGGLIIRGGFLGRVFIGRQGGGTFIATMVLPKEGGDFYSNNGPSKGSSGL